MASGDPLSNDDIERRVGTTTRTSDTSTVTTTETVADSVTAFLVAGRTYRVRWVVGYTSDVAGDSLFLRVREDTVSGTVMAVSRGYSPLTNGAGSRWVVVAEAEYTPGSSASKTFVGTYNRASGTGNVKVTAGTTTPTFLYVDYIRG
jgi:hypothetical protein